MRSPAEEQQAHWTFAAQCFADTWGLLIKPSRLPEEDDRMVDLAHASQWHWSRVEDVEPFRLATGYWLLSRVYAVIGEVQRSRHYAVRSMTIARDRTAPTNAYVEAYTYEAMARAAAVEGNPELCDSWAKRARELLPQIHAEDRAILEADLANLPDRPKVSNP
jgi:hypothetical protein